MVFLDKIRSFFDTLESRSFYYYIAGYLGVGFLFIVLFIFYYYKNVNALHRQIKKLNNTRADTVKVILESTESIGQQRSAVEAILAQNPDFKIAGYFKDLLIKLKLRNKEIQQAETTATTDREDNYRETELNAKFEDMTMKELTELLQALEQNPRISTKNLTITKAKKNVRAIDVQITITTLLPKVTEVS